MANLPKLPAPEDDDPLLRKVLYAGEGSATADKEALARAKAMKGQGAADAKILKETGWVLKPDGKWRSEISDQGSKLQPGIEERLQEQLGKLSGKFNNFSTETYRVRDLLKHDALEAAYPEVMDMPVDVGRIWRQGGGVLKLGVFDKDMRAPETLGLGDATPARDKFKTTEEYFQALVDAVKAKANASTAKGRGPVIQLDLPAIASDIDDNRPGTALGDAVRRVLVH
jgi:conjugative element/phage-associated large polyvalent protein